MTDATPESSVYKRFDIRAHRRPMRPWAGFVGLALVVAQALFLVVVRILAAALAFEEDLEPWWDLIFFLAGMLALGIVPALACVLLGWQALSQAWNHRVRDAVVGAITLGSGVVFAVWWLSRLINAAISSIYWDEYGGFATQVFWWA